VRALWPANLANHLPKLADHADEMDAGLVACLRAGEGVTMTGYQQLRARKYAYVAALHAWFADWDFLLTPAVSVAAFPAERLQPADWPEHPWDWVSWAEFSYPFNFAGNPAASIPCGMTPDGLPIGLQIVGRRFDDMGVLQAAAAFEAIAPWADRRPDL
jgi:aspartyl-tRNA(Asn)/glutamyl-tRNA(Gln) amidotransferase subunit A